MTQKHTIDSLVAFETKIAAIFDSGQIRAPIHLHAGNEQQLIDIFDRFKIGPEDWVLSSWRSHYHCLLKGVPPEELTKAILQGRSISLCFAKYHVLNSGIVGGQLPIATGIALGIKRRGGSGRVFCFMGDMTAETGIAHESIKYATNHGLPVHFIVEDNGKSVCTDTKASWALRKSSFAGMENDYVTYYQYNFDKYPHAGAGERVQF